MKTIKEINFSSDEKLELLAYARDVINSYFDSTITPKLSENKKYDLKTGLFLTLKINSNLRGCIGYIIGIKPIKDAVKDMAIQAAFHDPRFLPINEIELKSIIIEISIMSELKEVDDFKKIKIGRDGLFLESKSNSGLLLPQVAVQYNWDVEMFLQQTALKANLPINAYLKDDCKIFRFEAEVFSEKNCE